MGICLKYLENEDSVPAKDLNVDRLNLTNFTSLNGITSLTEHLKIHVSISKNKVRKKRGRGST